MQMSFKDMADLQLLFFGRLQIDVNITLRIDNRSFSIGANHV
jgi:hypothetical protein